MTLRVAVDHHQFIASDPTGELDIDAYNEEPQLARLAQWPRGVTVFTSSAWAETEVIVELHTERPTVDLTACDHAVEGGLSLPSGHLHIYGPETTGSHEPCVRIPSGEYSLLVTGSGFGTADPHGDDGDDTYRLILWPGTILSPRVLKQSPPE